MFIPLVLNCGFLILESVEVGIVNAIEYEFVCPEVYEKYDFMNILHKKDGDASDAFLVGALSSWPLIIPYFVSFVISIFYFDVTQFLVLNSVFLIINCFYDFLTLKTYKSDEMSIFRNSELFYCTHFLVCAVKIMFLCLLCFFVI